MDKTNCCGSCSRVRAATSVHPNTRHACNRPSSCGCPGPHFATGGIIAPADPLPVYRGSGCTWIGSDPTHCTNHDSPLVLVPVPHSGDGEAPVRMCRAFLAEASQATVPEPPRPTIVDQLAQRMNIGAAGWGTASHVRAARRTLAALPALDDETVTSLADTAREASMPRANRATWSALPIRSQQRWLDAVRALLDALAKAAD